MRSKFAFLGISENTADVNKCQYIFGHNKVLHVTSNGVKLLQKPSCNATFQFSESAVDGSREKPSNLENISKVF